MRNTLTAWQVRRENPRQSGHTFFRFSNSFPDCHRQRLASAQALLKFGWPGPSKTGDKMTLSRV